MTKRVAVIVRDRQQEALRMSVGLCLADNKVTVFMLDNRLERDEANTLAVETLGALGAEIVSTLPDNGFEQVSVKEMAGALASFDSIIPY